MQVLRTELMSICFLIADSVCEPGKVGPLVGGERCGRGRDIWSRRRNHVAAAKNDVAAQTVRTIARRTIRGG